MTYKPVLAIIMLISVLAAACSNTEEQADEGFPYSYIDDNFTYGGFGYPETWDVTAVSSNVQLTYRDDENPEEHKYSDTPYRYEFTFGLNAEENAVTDSMLEEYNKSRALNGETHRQLYYHSFREHFGTLQISGNGFIYLLSEYEDSETWEIGDTLIKVLRHENEWRANWHHGNAYYDLLVKNEAYVASEEAFQDLLTLMTGE